MIALRGDNLERNIKKGEVSDFIGAMSKSTKWWLRGRARLIMYKEVLALQNIAREGKLTPAQARRAAADSYNMFTGVIWCTGLLVGGMV